jgi:CheY-like chemotaxis protein
MGTSLADNIARGLPMPSRALVVDDEPAVIDLIEGVLVSTGMEVRAVVNSGEALALLSEEKFAVALLDFRMPPPSGVELARQMRSSGINQMTPIIFISDDQSIAAVSEGFAAGASLFLYKPIDKARLLRLVRSCQGAIEHERRRFSRVALRCNVRIGLDKQEWDCETIDISLSGMFVQGTCTIPAGSCVRISLELSPKGKPLIGSGYVVRVLAGNRMGIQMSRLPPAENTRLQEFLLPLILRNTRESSVPVPSGDVLSIRGSALRGGQAE